MTSLSQIFPAIPKAVQERVDAEMVQQEAGTLTHSALFAMSAWAQLCKDAGSFTGTLAGAALFGPTLSLQTGYHLLQQELSGEELNLKKAQGESFGWEDHQALGAMIAEGAVAPFKPAVYAYRHGTDLYGWWKDGLREGAFGLDLDASQKDVAWAHSTGKGLFFGLSMALPFVGEEGGAGVSPARVANPIDLPLARPSKLLPSAMPRLTGTPAVIDLAEVSPGTGKWEMRATRIEEALGTIDESIRQAELSSIGV